MPVFRILAIALFAALLPVASAAADDPLKDVHTVGVVSMLGKQIHINNLGVTIFSNKEGALALDWDIDGEVTARVAAIAKDRFTVVPVPADAEKVQAIRAGNSIRADLQKYLQDVTAANPVDAYIVIYPMQRETGLMGKRYAPRGLGFTRIEGLFSSSMPPTADAMYGIEFMDAKSGKLLVARLASLEEGGLFGSPQPILKTCDAILRAETPADVTEEQKAAMANELRYITLTSLSHTLERMGVRGVVDMSADAALQPAACAKYH